MAKKKASTGSVVNLDKYEYERTAIRDKSGKMRHSTGNGDAVANAMLLLHTTSKSLAGVIRDNGLTKKFEGRDPEANPGLFRMSVGVSLRALVKAGTPVTIGDVTVKSLKQHVPLPKPEKKAPVAAKKVKAKKASKPRAARKSKAVEAPAEQATA